MAIRDLIMQAQCDSLSGNELPYQHGQVWVSITNDSNVYELPAIVNALQIGVPTKIEKKLAQWLSHPSL